MWVVILAAENRLRPGAQFLAARAWGLAAAAKPAGAAGSGSAL